MPGGMFSKDKLIFDPANPLEGDNIGSYVRAGTDGDLISSTNVGGKEGLDVNVINTITISDPANYAEDAAHASGDIGKFILAVRHDADTSMVDADGDYAPLQVDENGNLKVVADLDVNFDYVYAEDTAHVSGDLGVFNLLVRQDTLAASTDATGDYGAFKSNARGGLWTVPVGTVADDAADDENPVKVGWRAYSGPLTAVTAGDRANAASDLYRRLYVNNGSNIAILQTQVDVDNTGDIAVPTTALAGRRTIMVQNLSSKEVYIGATGVTAADGFVVGARATISLDLGADVSLFVRGSQAGAQDLRVLELA
jgi:hypothetical protein